MRACERNACAPDADTARPTHTLILLPCSAAHTFARADVTDVPSDWYILRICVNFARTFQESTFDNVRRAAPLDALRPLMRVSPCVVASLWSLRPASLPSSVLQHFTRGASIPSSHLFPHVAARPCPLLLARTAIASPCGSRRQLASASRGTVTSSTAAKSRARSARICTTAPQARSRCRLSAVACTRPSYRRCTWQGRSGRGRARRLHDRCCGRRFARGHHDARDLTRVQG